MVVKQKRLVGANIGSTLGSGSLSSFTDTFVVADWSDAGSYYFLNVNHNLNTNDFEVTLWEDTGADFEKVEANIYQVSKSVNTVQVRISKTPDERFDGKILVSSVDGLVLLNNDVDTGTETIDSFVDSATSACRWDYFVNNGSGANMRAGTIVAVWDGVAASTPSFYETSTVDIGDTSGVTFVINKSGNTLQLQVTVNSDDWIVKVKRYPM